jgi:putative hydrolase of the HAD superfamily
MPTATLDAHTVELFRGIRTVVFDVVGTLLEPAPSVARAYQIAGRRQGVELAEAEIARRFSRAWARQEAADAAASPAFATSRQREHDRWRLIVEEVFDQTPAAAAIFAELWDHFGQPESWRSVPAGCRLLEAAREAGLAVAVASNFDERLKPLARLVEPLAGIDQVFASSELGWRKPAAEFFQAVAGRLSRQPGELLLVGDDPRLDLTAARAAGWRAVGVG